MVEQILAYTRWRNFLVPIAIVAFVLLLAVLFLPTMDGPNSRVRANESVAAANPRNITTFQNRYAALHPNDGFACDLTLLKSVMHDKNDHEPDAFLPAGISATELCSWDVKQVLIDRLRVTKSVPSRLHLGNRASELQLRRDWRALV